jgi:hypothetical protein
LSEFLPLDFINIFRQIRHEPLIAQVSEIFPSLGNIASPQPATPFCSTDLDQRQSNKNYSSSAPPSNSSDKKSKGKSCIWELHPSATALAFCGHRNVRSFCV